jgi:Na+/melibiose symporter-like transporter
MEAGMKEYNNAKLWQIGCFSLNNAATNLYMAMMLYVSYYANSVAGMGVVLISLLLTGMNVFDGITDPAAGYLLDSTQGKFGKFRPFMVLGNFLMAVSSLLLFFTTHLLPGYLRVGYFILVYGVFILGYTFQTVVGKSGQSALTDNPVQRPICTYFDSLFTMSSYGGVALFVSAVLVPRLGGFSSVYLFQVLAFLVVFLSALATVFAVIGIWEKDKPANFLLVQKEKKEKIRLRDYRDVMMHNRPIQSLILSACMNRFAATVYGHTAVGVMLFGIMMKDYSIAGLIGVITAPPTLVIVTGGIIIAQRFGQKKAFVVSIWGGIALQLAMLCLLLRKDVDTIHFSLKGWNGITMGFFWIFVLLNGCKSITNNMVVPMIADCTDYEVYRSGNYVPGLMGAMFSFVDKVFTALGTAFVGLVLAFAGFGERLPQVSDEATDSLRYITLFLYCVIPVIGWLCSALAMRFYRLDKRKMQQIQIEKSGKNEYEKDKSIY